jgi:Zn-dependent protease/predicted transcriptional regulator
VADAAESKTPEEGKRVGGLTSGAIYLFQVYGIKVTLNYSWLIIFALVVWGLSAGYFPHFFPDYGTAIYWAAGVVAALFFFASILIHELSHSITAVRLGIQIPEITLFVFGGVAHIAEEPADPETELKIAIVGPLASFALALIFWIIYVAIMGSVPTIITAIFEYLAWINLALGVFNLVPGYPLDGGRIFRALVWWRTGSVTKATKWASDIGKGFAWALMILGALEIFGGSLVGGLWLIFIGMFLRGIAATGYQEIMVRQSLEGVSVDKVMVEDVVSVPPGLSLEEVAQEYFLRYGHGGFPVMQEGKAIGVISLTNLKDVPAEERRTKTVREMMIPLDAAIQIRADDSLVEALKKMTQAGVGRLLVMRGDRCVGMITKSGLLRFMEIKQVLGQPDQG